MTVPLERITPSRNTILAALSPATRERLEVIRADCDAADARYQAAFNAKEEARRALSDLQSREAAADAEAARYGRRRDRAEVENAQAEAERLTRLSERHGEDIKAAIRRDNDGRHNFNGMLRYVDQNGSRLKPITIRIPKGNRLDIIEEHASKLAELRKQRIKVRQASVPAAELEAELLRQLDAEASRPILHIAGDRLLWPSELVQAAPDDLKPDAIPVATDLRPLLARLHRDVLADEIHLLVEKKYERVQLAMPLTEKLARVMELDEAILATERTIAESTWTARAEGVDIGFPRLDPRALLGVSGPPPNKRRDDALAEEDDLALAEGTI